MSKKYADMTVEDLKTDILHKIDVNGGYFVPLGFVKEQRWTLFDGG